MATLHFSTWNAVVLAFAVTAAVGDIRWRKIPRALTTAGVIVGLLFHAVYGGFLTAALASVLGFVLGLAFFRLGAVGGGDVKLMTALGAMLGLKPWLFAMEVAILAAGVLALVQAVRAGRLRQTIRNMGETLRWVRTSGLQTHPVINASNPAMLRSPFGVAAAVGTFMAVIKL